MSEDGSIGTQSQQVGRREAVNRKKQKRMARMLSRRKRAKVEADASISRWVGKTLPDLPCRNQHHQRWTLPAKKDPSRVQRWDRAILTG